MSRKDSKAVGKDRKGAERLLPSLRKYFDNDDNPVLAIIIGDVHLRSKPPIARSAEPDWYEAMERYLSQIRKIQNTFPEAETFYVGDIFHKWDSSARLINFALRHLPRGYTIFGQHDLPFHNPKDLHYSAFWTLTHNDGIIEHLPKGLPCRLNGKLMVTGFGWKEKIKFQEVESSTFTSEPNVNLALVHKYIWYEGFSYGSKAPKSSHVNLVRKRLKGFTHAYFGDNHIPFLVPNSEPQIVNCGSIIPTNKDQRDYVPAVHLIYTDGSISWHTLDTSKDKWLTVEQLEKKLSPTVDLRGLLERIQNIGSKPLSLRKILVKLMTDKKVKKSVRRLIRDLLEECEE